MNSHQLELLLASELKETLRVKKLNLELMEALEFTVLFMLSEADKNNSKPPNWKRLHGLLIRVRKIYSELYPPTRLQQPKRTPDKDNTTRKFVITHQQSESLPLPLSARRGCWCARHMVATGLSSQSWKALRGF